MAFEITTLRELYVIGISVRTSNQNGQAQADIGALWGKLRQENLLTQIPNKVSHEIYCVYTDHESDFQGPYTTILGSQVHTLETSPTKLTGKTIPAANYQVYPSKGKLPDCVAKTWNFIWQTNLNRKYTADFDVYGQQTQNPEAAEVKTFVCVF